MIFVARYFFCFDRFCFCHLHERPPVAHLQFVHIHLKFGPGRDPGSGRGIGFQPSIGSCTISSGLFSISMFDLDVRNPDTCKTTMKNTEVQQLFISDFGSRWKWTVSGKSGQFNWVKVDGPNSKAPKVDGLKHGSSLKLVVHENWTEPSKRLNVDGLWELTTQRQWNGWSLEILVDGQKDWNWSPFDRLLWTWLVSSIYRTWTESFGSKSLRTQSTLWLCSSSSIILETGNSHMF